jgi:hypothetical protein
VTNRIALMFFLATALSACGATDTPSSKAPIPADIRGDVFQLPARSVTIEADPPPPFTYWAPDGAVIRNHGNPGVWVAYLDGRSVATYFGDECGASEFQRYIGEPLSTVPTPPEGVMMRAACSTCAVTDDLRRDRLNVVFEEDTQRVASIACY